MLLDFKICSLKIFCEDSSLKNQINTIRPLFHFGYPNGWSLEELIRCRSVNVLVRAILFLIDTLWWKVHLSKELTNGESPFMVSHWCATQCMELGNEEPPY